MATRIGLAQQNGRSEVDADTICDCAAFSACEKSHGWQLALGLLSRMAEAKWKRTPFAIVRQSVPARRATNGNSHPEPGKCGRGRDGLSRGKREGPWQRVLKARLPSNLADLLAAEAKSSVSRST